MFGSHVVNHSLAKVDIRDEVEAIFVQVCTQLGRAAANDHDFSVLVLVQSALDDLLNLWVRNVPLRRLVSRWLLQLGLVPRVPELATAVVRVLSGQEDLTLHL